MSRFQTYFTAIFFSIFLLLEYIVALDFYGFHYPRPLYLGYFSLWGGVLLLYLTNSFLRWNKSFFVSLQFLFLFTLIFTLDGKVDHGLTVYYWISLITLILSLQKWIAFPLFLSESQMAEKNEGMKFYLLIALTCFFALYFCAGVWKVRVLFYTYQLTGDWVKSLESLAREIFSYQYFFQAERREYLFLFSPKSWPVLFGLSATIFLQLASGGYVFWVAGEFKFWRVALMVYLSAVSLFHLSMIYFFDIWFIEQLVLFLLISTSYLYFVKNKKVGLIR